MSKRFHIGDVLTITTGRLVSTRHMDGVYEILNHMTGELLFTHALPRACRACAPALLRAFPQLAGADTGEDWRAWLADATAKHGEWFDVEPLAPGDYVAMDPISELRAMRPDMPITVAVIK